ncbi:hypothetical protein [Streptomyces sirii]|uniref:hypothetical protein n=1 Tax=Streptomyces sirii TaxID=3127701 RepID=UPI003D36BE5D
MQLMEQMEQIRRELCALNRQLFDIELGRIPMSRDFLVRRAAALDRMAEVDHPAQRPQDAAETVTDAVGCALELLEWDTEHTTACGPIPASAAHWRDDPRGYAQQEHRAWVLANETP